MNDEFIKAPIYKVYSWPVERDSDKYYISEENSKKIMSFFRDGTHKLKTFCVFCEDNESFTCEGRLSKRVYGTHVNVCKVSYNGNDIFEMVDNNLFYISSDLNKSYMLYEDIKCNLVQKHLYRIYYEMQYFPNSFVIRKIGQNVSPYEIGLPESKVYEKQLKKFSAVEDYRKAFTHRVYGDYIAALLYLRRVFEKLVLYLLDDAELEDNHFETKIKKLKEDNKLNPQVDELTKSVYNLLSKGIHELTNDECMSLFSSLRLFIDMQLLYIKTEQEKENELQELKKEIKTKHSKYL